MSGQATLSDKLPHIFTYQKPTEEQIPKYHDIREKALAFAKAIVTHTPACADQTAAIRLVREAVMTANAAIGLNGLI